MTWRERDGMRAADTPAPACNSVLRCVATLALVVGAASAVAATDTTHAPSHVKDKPPTPSRPASTTAAVTEPATKPAATVTQPATSPETAPTPAVSGPDSTPSTEPQAQPPAVTTPSPAASDAPRHREAGVRLMLAMLLALLAVVAVVLAAWALLLARGLSRKLLELEGLSKKLSELEDVGRSKNADTAKEIESLDSKCHSLVNLVDGLKQDMSTQRTLLERFPPDLATTIKLLIERAAESKQSIDEVKRSNDGMKQNMKILAERIGANKSNLRPAPAADSAPSMSQAPNPTPAPAPAPPSPVPQPAKVAPRADTPSPMIPPIPASPPTRGVEDVPSKRTTSDPDLADDASTGTAVPPEAPFQVKISDELIAAAGVPTSAVKPSFGSPASPSYSAPPRVPSTPATPAPSTPVIGSRQSLSEVQNAADAVFTTGVPADTDVDALTTAVFAQMPSALSLVARREGYKVRPHNSSNGLQTDFSNPDFISFARLDGRGWLLPHARALYSNGFIKYYEGDGTGVWPHFQKAADCEIDDSGRAIVGGRGRL